MPSVWPADLPQRLQQSAYSQSIPDGLIRSENDVGPAKVRLRSSAATAPLTGDMMMTGDQLASLQTFVQTTLLGGSLPFTFPDPLGGSNLLVRLTGMPTWGSIGGRYFLVSFKLETLGPASGFAALDFTDASNGHLLVFV